MNSKEITYRKKKYFDYAKNTKTSYHAIRSCKNIMIMMLTEDMGTKDLISSTYHNFTDKNEYNKNFQEIYQNDKYMITKHEFNRLFKEFKNQFKSNCLI